MREILFRGKRVDNGEWVQGFYFVEAGHFIKELPSCVSTLTYLVLPETICQYTGLTDKNGKKIFEGDIVRHYNDERMPEAYDIGCIIFNTCECMFRRTAAGRNDTFAIARHCLYEVIGNIHDKPELMGGKGNDQNEPLRQA